MKKYWLTFDVLSTVLTAVVKSPPTSASIGENVNGERGGRLSCQSRGRSGNEDSDGSRSCWRGWRWGVRPDARGPSFSESEVSEESTTKLFVGSCRSKTCRGNKCTCRRKNECPITLSPRRPLRPGLLSAIKTSIVTNALNSYSLIKHNCCTG